MTTDKIIRDEFEKSYDIRKTSIRDFIIFEDGWHRCEDWHERQNMMDRDYQEQIQEEARLAEGR